MSASGILWNELYIVNQLVIFRWHRLFQISLNLNQRRGFSR